MITAFKSLFKSNNNNNYAKDKTNLTTILPGETILEIVFPLDDATVCTFMQVSKYLRDLLRENDLFWKTRSSVNMWEVDLIDADPQVSEIRRFV